MNMLDFQFLAFFHGLWMMDSDIPSYLVMQPDFFILGIIISWELSNSVHAHIRSKYAVFVRIFRIDLGKKNKRLSTAKAFYLRYVWNSAFGEKSRPVIHNFEEAEIMATEPCDNEWFFMKRRSALKSQYLFTIFQGWSENKSRPVHCSEKIGHGRKRRSFLPFQRNSWAFFLENPSVDLCHFKVRVNLFLHTDKMAIFFKINYTLWKTGIYH